MADLGVTATLAARADERDWPGQAERNEDSSPGPGRRQIAGMLALLLLILALACSAIEFGSPGTPEDEGLLLVYPELVLHGQAPFSTFQSSYGPGAYLPLSAAYAVTGPSVAVERVVGGAYRLAVVAAIAWLLWPLGEGLVLAGLLLVILSMFAPPPAEATGWYFALACVLTAIATARAGLLRSGRGAVLRWGLAGVLAGLAVSARFDLAAALAVGMTVMLLRAGWKARVVFLAGVLVGAAPLIWDLLAAGLSNFWTYAVQARLNQLPVSGYPFPTGVTGLAVLAAATLIVLAASIAAWRRKGLTPITATWLALAAIAVVLVPQMLQRPDRGHFAYVAPVAVGLLPWAFAQLRRPLVGVGLTMICALAVIADGLALNGGPVVTVHNQGRSFPYSTGFHPADMQAMLNWTRRHVPAGRRLLVGPRDFRWPLDVNTALYYLQPEFPHAGFYLELGPGDTTQAFERRITADLENAQVLELDGTDYRGTWPEARASSNAPNRIVARDFTQVFQAGPDSVWLRRSQDASGAALRG